MTTKHLKYEQKLEIKKLYQDGTSLQVISQLFDINEETILRMVKQLGNKSNQNRKKLSEGQIDEICELYHNGLSMPKIAKKYNVSASLIRKKLVSRGVKRRDASAAHRKYAIHEDFFDNINNEKKAYFLGFLYADGCNHLKKNYVSLGLKNTDKEILLKLAALIYKKDPSEQVKTYDRTHEGKGKEVRLTINSQHICHQLEKLGCPQAKTFKITYPQWLPPHLHCHFVRGYFDGDGGATVKYLSGVGARFKITSTENFIRGLQKVIEDQVGIKVPIGVEKTISTLRSTGNVLSIKLLNWLYKDATIFLGRKYDLYLELINQNKYSNSLAVQGTRGFGKSNIEKTQEICETIGFSSPITLNGQELTKQYIKTLSEKQRVELSKQVFDFFRSNRWKYPDDLFKVNSEFSKLCNYESKTNSKVINGNHALGTYICKFFCHSFYRSKNKYKKSTIEVFEDDFLLMKVIRNRLGLDWKKSPEFFDISYKNLIKGMRVCGVSAQISMFKPSVAKYMAEKFSKENELVFDYAGGFGGRLLGTVAANRKYLGTDPLTHKELTKMIDFLRLQNATILDKPSENLKLEANIADLAWSSPPYFDQEIYSEDIKQCYTKDSDYFYNIYWQKTLEITKNALKPNKVFGVNVKNQPKMVEMAQGVFGSIQDRIELQYPSSHFHKKDENKKEYIYIFTNNK